MYNTKDERIATHLECQDKKPRNQETTTRNQETKPRYAKKQRINKMHRTTVETDLRKHQVTVTPERKLEITIAVLTILAVCTTGGKHNIQQLLQKRRKYRIAKCYRTC